MRRKLYLSILGALAAILAPLLVGGFIFWRMRLLKAELTALGTELLVLETKQQNVKTLKKNLEQARAEREKLDRIFITEKNLVRFIEDLEAWAKEAGVAIKMEQALLPSSPGEEGPLFQFRVTGEFPNLFRYQLLLENSSYLIISEKVRWEKLSREGADARGPGWSTSYTLKVTSYLF